MSGGGWSGGERGQASVETVALAPIVGALVIALVVALQAHRAGEAAGLASHAAALAAMQGRDVEDAARAAVPDVGRERLRIRVDGAQIVVRVRASGPRSLVAPFDAERTVVARREDDR
ncbi:hypothetical protein [Patulibacter americanus]|uniref:hypothetical protein n=1 Tax=Patulibacter americanus TaxID=588672 RepID=UPI000406B881|nr:hypothetical protein [Patulibacter americanus]